MLITPLFYRSLALDNHFLFAYSLKGGLHRKAAMDRHGDPLTG
jgi:hypothetical protein